MPLYLDTTGNTSLAIAICGRCKMKYPIGHLVSDPNAPGLRVCRDTCVDQYDPWRLPARRSETITLQYPRPDLPLIVGPEDIEVTGTVRVLADNVTYRVLSDGVTVRVLS